MTTQTTTVTTRSLRALIETATMTAAALARVGGSDTRLDYDPAKILEPPVMGTKTTEQHLTSVTTAAKKEAATLARLARDRDIDLESLADKAVATVAQLKAGNIPADLVEEAAVAATSNLLAFMTAKVAGASTASTSEPAE